jgi:hypothetical protein
MLGSKLATSSVTVSLTKAVELAKPSRNNAHVQLWVADGWLPLTCSPLLVLRLWLSGASPMPSR